MCSSVDTNVWVEKQEDIKNRVIKEFKDQPIPHLFGKNLINA